MTTPGYVFHDRTQLVPLLFMQDAVAADQTDADLPIIEDGATSGTTAVVGYVMPWSGTIVGISATLSAAASAGTLTVGPTIGGTEQADPTLSITDEAEKSDTALRGAAPFAAGDVIGAQITTDGSWNGTSSDLGVVVWVLLDVAGV